MEQKDESYYIERILDGETEYFSVFLDRYSRPLYTLVVQIVGCPEDAEELLQDIFLKAFRNLNRYKGECRFSTWIYRIAYNAAISATRKKKQEFLYIEENTINNVPDEMADNVLAPAETEEQLDRLSQAIDQLSGEEKALITLFIIFSVSFILVPIWFVKIIILAVALFHFYYFGFKIKTAAVRREEVRDYGKRS